MVIDIGTVVGAVALAGICGVGLRLYLRTRVCSADYQADLVRWESLRASSQNDGADALAEILEKTVTGPLGRALSHKLTQGIALAAQASSPAEYRVSLEEVLASRDPSDDLDAMARRALLVAFANLVIALLASTVLSQFLVAPVGVAGVLISLTALGRVDGLRGMVTRESLHIGQMLFTSFGQQSPEPTPDVHGE